jgi:hypothetical protein
MAASDAMSAAMGTAVMTAPIETGIVAPIAWEVISPLREVEAELEDELKSPYDDPQE